MASYIYSPSFHQSGLSSSSQLLRHGGGGLLSPETWADEGDVVCILHEVAALALRGVRFADEMEPGFWGSSVAPHPGDSTPSHPSGSDGTRSLSLPTTIA